ATSCSGAMIPGRLSVGETVPVAAATVWTAGGGGATGRARFAPQPARTKAPKTARAATCFGRRTNTVTIEYPENLCALLEFAYGRQAEMAPFHPRAVIHGYVLETALGQCQVGGRCADAAPTGNNRPLGPVEPQIADHAVDLPGRGRPAAIGVFEEGGSGQTLCASDVAVAKGVGLVALGFEQLGVAAALRDGKDFVPGGSQRRPGPRPERGRARNGKIGRQRKTRGFPVAEAAG